MNASRHLDLINNPPPQILQGRESPGWLAWKAFRAISRFLGSVFFSFFRVWGETELKKTGQVFVVRNLGLQTWLCVLRIFRQPLRFVHADVADRSPWFGLAERGGLAPLKLSGDADQDFLTVEHLLESGEKLVLVIPEHPGEKDGLLVGRLKATHSLKVLFMAINGAQKAMPVGAIVPRAAPVSVFCGMPHYQSRPGDSAFAELELLERSLQNLAIDEIPSIFANHRRNIGNQSA